jgi:guanylate kinase
MSQPTIDSENGLRGRGILFVVSSPSGGGKTTLCRKLLAEFRDLVLSVSHTTRPPREGEKNGRDYHFIGLQAFGRMRTTGEFLEWAEVYGRFYGTSRTAVEAILARGGDVLLDIDVQGALQIRERFPSAVLVFILPPGEAELARRLASRGTETAAAMQTRLAEAKKELAVLPRYDYAVLNHDLETAYGALRSILVAERCKVSRRAGHEERRPLSAGI